MIFLDDDTSEDDVIFLGEDLSEDDEDHNFTEKEIDEMLEGLR